jgi:hypothetical protein
LSAAASSQGWSTILYRANQEGKKTSADIAERVQIVLKGNELLLPAGGSMVGAA